jgi:hypothetical protein
MKKLIALGLSAVTAGTFAFTLAAPAAHADTIITTVCNALPNMNLDASNAQLKAQNDATVADQTLSTKTSARDAATASYIQAVIDELNAIVGGNVTDINNAVALVGVRQSALGTAFADWSNANAADQAAHTALDVANWGQGVVSDLTSGLC